MCWSSDAISRPDFNNAQVLWLDYGVPFTPQIYIHLSGIYMHLNVGTFIALIGPLPHISPSSVLFHHFKETVIVRRVRLVTETGVGRLLME
jgi:hypothetical protein